MIDPQTFPPTGDIEALQPEGAPIRTLFTGGNDIVISQNLADSQGLQGRRHRARQQYDRTVHRARDRQHRPRSQHREPVRGVLRLRLHEHQQRRDSPIPDPTQHHQHSAASGRGRRRGGAADSAANQQRIDDHRHPTAPPKFDHRRRAGALHRRDGLGRAADRRRGHHQHHAGDGRAAHRGDRRAQDLRLEGAAGRRAVLRRSLPARHSGERGRLHLGRDPERRRQPLRRSLLAAASGLAYLPRSAAVRRGIGHRRDADLRHPAGADRQPHPPGDHPAPQRTAHRRSRRAASADRADGGRPRDRRDRRANPWQRRRSGSSASR